MRSHSHPPLGSPPSRWKLLAQLGRDCSSAEALLGDGHPLVAVLRRGRTTVEQVSVVAFIQVVAGVLDLEHAGESFAPALTIAASFVQVGLCLRLATLMQARRALCLELIIGGAERLPLGVVELERRRLESPRRLARLARALDEVADTALHPLPWLPASRPLFNVYVVRPAAAQLREIADLLRTDAPPLRGVALIERLITSGVSPLYGKHVDQLLEELRRARYVLCG